MAVGIVVSDKKTAAHFRAAASCQTAAKLSVTPAA
jgi:hypothetical protein